MKGVPESLIRRYVRSLFSAAYDLGVLERVREDLQQLQNVWDGNPELAAFLVNPGLSRRQVRGILTSISDRVNLNKVTRQFVNLLMTKDRVEILPAVGPVFEELWRKNKGIVEVRVITATEIGETLRGTIENHLREQSGLSPRIRWERDPAILGGLVVHWPDRVFDGSLARKLTGMREYMAQAVS